MRIALLSAAKSIHTQRWAAALAARGHTVAVFSVADHRAPPGSFPPDVAVHNLRCKNGLGYWFGAGELRAELAAFRPDILNAHYATGYGTLARRCAFHPLLLSVWGSDVYEFPARGGFCRRMLCRNLESADAIASTSEAMARRVERLLPARRPVFITPFGVDPAVFHRVGEPEPDALTVGIVKALEPKYGVDILLRAFALLRTRLQKEHALPAGGLWLSIVGSGSQRATLEKRAGTLGIAENVRFSGAVPHARVPEVLCRFDIFCAPSVSDSESFGVAAVEAMACEVPVAVSDADGFREVVVDGETGFIVPKGDAVLLANRLHTLCLDPALRRKMGAAGRRHVLEKFAWQSCVDRMEDALTRTLLQSRNPARSE